MPRHSAVVAVAAAPHARQHAQRAVAMPRDSLRVLRRPRVGEHWHCLGCLVDWPGRPLGGHQALGISSIIDGPALGAGCWVRATAALGIQRVGRCLLMLPGAAAAEQATCTRTRERGVPTGRGSRSGEPADGAQRLSMRRRRRRPQPCRRHSLFLSCSCRTHPHHRVPVPGRRQGGKVRGDV